MHMADALISPAVGVAMLTATAGLATISIKKIQDRTVHDQIPLMGVMGAFVFAAQMVNFSIMGTGSSGHLGGGMLLAILLGPSAGFLTMASILLVQALFFADGGLLAYGCNVVNLAFYTCLVVYPLIYRPMLSRGWNVRRIWVGSMLSSVIGLQLGAFSVVLQTVLSGKTELPFTSFLLLMQPIHLVIGLIEGLVTAAVVSFIWKARPELLERTPLRQSVRALSMRKVLVTLIIAAVVISGGLSLIASTLPDGLEWSIAKASGDAELSASEAFHQIAAKIQSWTAILPDYQLKSADSSEADSSETNTNLVSEQAGTALSGMVGAGLTLALTVLIGLLAVWRKRRILKETATG